MQNDFAKHIFKNASSTYYFASLLFPKEIRDDVFILYAFVRTADDYVDAIPQQEQKFYEFRHSVSKAFLGKKTKDPIIDSFFALSRRKKFKRVWIEAFLDAMEQDLTKKTYKSFSQLEEYMYGSAEVIGLFMAQIMELDKSSSKTAKLQGKAMQLINFIRDVREDMDMHRQYLPTDDLKQFGLSSLTLRTSSEKQKFKKLILFELTRYFHIQKEAEKGYIFLPRRYRLPIQTASELYKWAALEILKDPLVVLRKKVKPSKLILVKQYVKNFVATV